MRILTISGSLRALSSNSVLLRAAASLAPSGVEVTPYEGVGLLPHFSPDLDRSLGDPDLPPAVVTLRACIAAADGILISSPEYAHGVPGSFKNALDWLVGGDEIPGKPVALLNASPRSVFAQASLAETLRTMSARIVPGSPFLAPMSGKQLDELGAVSDPEVSAGIRAAFSALVDAGGHPPLDEPERWPT